MSAAAVISPPVIVNAGEPNGSAVRSDIVDPRAYTFERQGTYDSEMNAGINASQERRLVDLSAVTEEVLKLLRSTIPAGIVLEKNFALDAPQVLADAAQIHEAIVNLTTNAAHAIGLRAGSIDYRLEPVLLAGGIPDLKQGRYARLSVTDSGEGMDAAAMQRIFDALHATRPVGEGKELGLSMVHGTMSRHGGVVTVASTSGKGCSIALYFPATEEKSQQEEQSVPGLSPLSVAKRVLYVDDEEPLLSLARRMISRLGYSMTGFTDPKEALAAFRAHPQDFDLVVTDLLMPPHMSGFELAHELLALRPEIPVLMTTGYLRAEDQESIRAAGIRELMLKPVSLEELGRVLERLFSDTELTAKPPA